MSNANIMSMNLDNYFEQGLAEFEAGNYHDAIQLFDQALRLSLGNLAEIHLYRGEAYAYLKEWDKAMRDFNLALQYDPHLAEAYNERGNVLRFMGNYEDALAEFSNAIQLAPTSHEAYYNRALAFEEIGNFDAAETDLTQTIKLNAGIAAAYESRARVRIVKKDIDGAIEDLERYLRMGGGREFDNHSEMQSLLINLRARKFLSNLLKR